MKRTLLLLLLLFSCCLNNDTPPPKRSQTSLTLHAEETCTSHELPYWLREASIYKTPDPLPESLVVESLFGTHIITHPLLIELLKHPVLERIKEIDQHGPATHFGNWPTWSRYDHCVGVFALLHLHNRPLVEQVAGLLHDVSHTAFSHSADHLFKTGNDSAYQDSIHTCYLEHMGLAPILARYGLTIEEINPDRPEFTALERKNPILCADRIHYNFHAGLAHGLLTQEEIHQMAQTLRFENEEWFFTNQEYARKLAEVALYYCEHALAPAANLVWHHWLCDALRRAAALGIINTNDIHFGTDKYVLAKLEQSEDLEIKTYLAKCHAPEPHYTIAKTPEEADLVDYPKLRAIDPLVKLSEESEGAPLTQRDPEYQVAMNSLRTRLLAGVQVKFL